MQVITMHLYTGTLQPQGHLPFTDVEHGPKENYGKAMPDR